MKIENVSHKGGVKWFDAAPPPRFHRCRPQTSAIDDGLLIERCACGSIRLDGNGPWMEKNARRKANT